MADVRSQTDYSAFHVTLDDRQWYSTTDSNEYRFGINGQERNDEIYGAGNSYTAEYWQYDPRLGRRWNVDPVIYSFQSGYTCFNNNPVVFVDIKGLEGENPQEGQLSSDGNSIWGYDATNGEYRWVAIGTEAIVQGKTPVSPMFSSNSSLFSYSGLPLPAPGVSAPSGPPTQGPAGPVNPNGPPGNTGQPPFLGLMAARIGGAALATVWPTSLGKNDIPPPPIGSYQPWTTVTIGGEEFLIAGYTNTGLYKLPVIHENGKKYVVLYRGVPNHGEINKQQYINAKNGMAIPRGLSTDVDAHNEGNTQNSAFTSWSYNYNVAHNRALMEGAKEGIVLRGLFPLSDVILGGNPDLGGSPDNFKEQEVLLMGIRMGIPTTVTKE